MSVTESLTYEILRDWYIRGTDRWHQFCKWFICFTCPHLGFTQDEGTDEIYCAKCGRNMT